MAIKISDCTIRDGGYLANKNFTEKFVKGVIEGLVSAGIDYIETGFLQDKVGGESIVYKNSADVQKYIPSNRGKSSFVGFCDNSRYSVKNLDDYDGKSFENLRISFAKHECEDALAFCAAAKQKGYRVFVQPMDAPGYNEAERRDLVLAVNEIMPEAFAIVDTFGTMHLSELCTIFRQVDKLLHKNIKVGLHTHNNLNLSNALVEQLIDMAVESDRSVSVDGSLMGMARGAGNACTEVIAHFLNTKYDKSYNMSALLKTIEKYIIPMMSVADWGYSVPMFVCGATSSHVDNISYLSKNSNADFETMYRVLESMSIDKRKRYGVGYSKSDFTALREAFNHMNLGGDKL